MSIDTADFFQTLSLEEIKEKSEKFLLGNYSHPMEIALSFGQGGYVYDTDGKQYIDFLCGISVTNLGHGEADVVEAIRDQAERLLHSSNLFFSAEQALLAEALIGHSFPGKVFFANSGTEANEAAFKLARSFGQEHKDGAGGFITFDHAFHGRTTAAMVLTPQEKVHGGFGPILKGDITYLPANDVDLLEREFENNGNNLCGVFIEFVQGEGGIHVMEQDFVNRLRELCDEYEVLFIADEIQTGLGRTGKLFAYEHYGIQPDVMTLAKALGNGLPIGAMIAAEKYAPFLGPGKHGSTFGGNHLTCRVAFETLKIIIGRELLNNVAAMSEYFFRRLKVWETQFPAVKDVRGMGLHIGVELDRPGLDFVRACRDKGLIINCTAGNVIRIMPPLNVGLELAAAGLDIMEGVLKELQ